MNEHAGREGYAIVLKRTKKSKLGITNKVWIICDRGRKKHQVTGQNRRHGGSRHIECPFSVIAKLDEDIQTWLYEVKNPEHTHTSSAAGSHPVLRRMAITAEMRSEVSRQLNCQNRPISHLIWSSSRRAEC